MNTHIPKSFVYTINKSTFIKFSLIIAELKGHFSQSWNTFQPQSGNIHLLVNLHLNLFPPQFPPSLPSPQSNTSSYTVSLIQSSGSGSKLGIWTTPGQISCSPNSKIHVVFDCLIFFFFFVVWFDCLVFFYLLSCCILFS